MHGVQTDVRNRVRDIATEIRNLPDLDIGITQRTANALAARSRLIAE